MTLYDTLYAFFSEGNFFLRLAALEVFPHHASSRCYVAQSILLHSQSQQLLLRLQFPRREDEVLDPMRLTIKNNLLWKRCCHRCVGTIV
jgi:hypothetical protein